MEGYNSGFKSVLLIVGAPRSGTTLLSGLVSENAETYPMLPECTNITQIIQHYHNFVHYADSQRFRTYGVSPDRLIIPYRQMVNSLIDLAASNFEGQNYCHLVLKDPELSLLVDEIPNFFCKDVKVVCIVRDPRAVIASMIRVWQKKRAESWRLFRQSPSWTATGEYLQCIVRAKTLPGVVFNYYWRFINPGYVKKVVFISLAMKES